MAFLFEPGIYSIITTGSALAPGATMTFYDAGTTTLKNTYPTKSDAEAATNENANPLTIGADGRLPVAVWFDDTLYKVKLTMPDGSTKTVDNVGNSIGGSNGSGEVGFSHSATYAASTLGRKEQQFVSVSDAPWNAVGDGSTDDTTAFTSALAHCANIGAILKGSPGKAYSISTVTVADGVGGMDFRDCTIKGRGGTTSTGGVIVLGSDGSGVTDAEFHLRIDMSAGDLNAILGYDTKRCKFTDCDISGFTNNATYNHYGIWLIGDVQDVTIKDNRIVGYDTPTQRGLLISVTGEGITAYGGFFTGTIARASTPAKRIIITDNHLINGSYAVTFQGVEDSQVNDNVCDDQNHRNMYLANSCWRVVIDGNIMKEGLSSGVVVSYGCGNCVVTNNVIQTTTTSGEAGVNINTGACDNYVACNKIDGPFNYSIYVATDSLRNTIEGNECSNFYLAAIGVDNDWISPRPTNAIFARPNYAAPEVGSVWSQHDLDGTVITNNVIKQGYTGRSTAAISLSQITTSAATGITNTVISGNKVVSADNIAYNLAIYADTDAELTGTKIKGHVAHSGNTQYCRNTGGDTTWNKYLAEHAENGLLGRVIEAEVIAFADGDTTPSVATNNRFRRFKTSNTSNTTITNFDDGFDGQQLLIRLDTFTGITHSGGTLNLKASTSITAGSRSTNDFITFVRTNNAWLETGRNW